MRRVLASLLLAGPVYAQVRVTLKDGDLGPGLRRDLFGSYQQVGDRFGDDDDARMRIAPGTRERELACQPNCASLPHLGATAPAGCDKPERFHFGYFRQDLGMRVQRLWLDPNDVTGRPCGSCGGSAAAVVECQMRKLPSVDEQSMDRDGSGARQFGTGYVASSYHEVLAGILAEGITPYVTLRSPHKMAPPQGCPFVDLTCQSPACLDDIEAQVSGFYEYVRRNSAGSGCEPRCDFPKDALDRIIWGFTYEPDLGKGLGFFGPSGYASYGLQLDRMLSVPYPKGFHRTVAAPDLSTALSVDDPKGHRKGWLAAVRNKVDIVTYHGLYCGKARNADVNLRLPARLRAELGTRQPLWCTEYANNEIMNRGGPCHTRPCGGSAPPDCGHNKLEAGMLEESKGLLYQTRSDAGLAGTLVLGVMEGAGVACGGETGLGLVGTSTRRVDEHAPGKELLVQGASITYYAFRMIVRDLGWDGDGRSHVLPTTAQGDLVEAARVFADGSIALVLVNDGPAQKVAIDLAQVGSLKGPLEVQQRVVAPAHLDARGKPAPLLDVVQSNRELGSTFTTTLEARSVTSIRAGRAGRRYLPSVASLDPPRVAACDPAPVRLKGTGFASGDLVRVGERSVPLRCDREACTFEPPARELPKSARFEDVTVRIQSRVNGAVSNELPLSYVRGPQCAEPRVPSSGSAWR